MNFRSDIQNPHQVTKFSLVGLSYFVHLMGSIAPPYGERGFCVFGELCDLAVLFLGRSISYVCRLFGSTDHDKSIQ